VGISWGNFQHWLVILFKWREEAIVMVPVTFYCLHAVMHGVDVTV
jgi:hypothetical protein